MQREGDLKILIRAGSGSGSGDSQDGGEGDVVKTGNCFRAKLLKHIFHYVVSQCSAKEILKSTLAACIAFIAFAAARASANATIARFFTLTKRSISTYPA